MRQKLFAPQNFSLLLSFSVSLKQPIITGIVHILQPHCKKLFGIPNMTEII